MATVGIHKDDPSIILAHLRDEGKNYPAVHARLEFRDEGDKITPVVTFVPIVDEKAPEEEQKFFAEKLKALIVDYLKPALRFQWSPADEHLCVLIIKDGKKMIVPLKSEKPPESGAESKVIL
jgi:hypothetical protein